MGKARVAVELPSTWKKGKYSVVSPSTVVFASIVVSAPSVTTVSLLTRDLGFVRVTVKLVLAVRLELAWAVITTVTLDESLVGGITSGSVSRE